MKKHKILYRSKKNKLLGGVCGGIGSYLKIDPNIVRVAWVSAMALFWVAGVLWIAGPLLYLVGWAIIPVQA